MVLIIEPCSMSSPERIFQGKIKETSTRAGMEAYAPSNFSVGNTRLVFQEEVVFEQWEAWRNPKVSFAEMDKDGDLENGDRVQMDKLYLIVVEKSTEEITSRVQPALEERGKHHNFVCIGCGNVFSDGRPPLQHDTIGEKIVLNKFVNFFFVCDRQLQEVVGMRGGHC
jgi:hypothetical protein